MIKNENVFKRAVQKATEIRSHIQDKLRFEYKGFQKAFSILTGKEGKFLKFFTDIIYYRKGGYPSAGTLPKHEQYTLDFIEMVKFLDFIGLKQSMLDPVFKQHGLNITIDPSIKYSNDNLSGDAIVKAQEVIRKSLKNKTFTIRSRTTRDLIKELLKYTNELQKQICESSDTIKYNLATIVDKNCDITKEDFQDQIKFEIDLKKDKLTPGKIKDLKKDMKSKVGVSQQRLQSIDKNRKNIPKE